MRSEVLNWLKQARANFSSANSNFRTGVYFTCAFMCQQCAEAALKAVCLHNRKQLRAMHNLRELGILADAPDEIIEDLVELNPDYIVSRYPDAANGVPAEMYDAKKADRKLLAAKSVLEWAESCLKE